MIKLTPYMSRETTLEYLNQRLENLKNEPIYSDEESNINWGKRWEILSMIEELKHG